MRDAQYFSKLRGFLSGKRRRKSTRTCGRRSSSFRLESLEARVLLSGVPSGAISVTDILSNPTFGTQQAVVQNVQTAPTTTATTPTLTLNGSAASTAIAPGATMTVNVANPTGNPKDWIGIYQVGQSSNTKSVVEHYVDRTDYAIPSTTPAGTYEARLFANDSLTLLATSSPFTVGTGIAPISTPTPTPTASQTPTTTPTSTTTPALTLNGSTGPVAVTPGATVSVNVVNPTGNALDWIGIYQVGQSSSTKSVVEHYVASTDYTIPSTAPAGTYEARLFANDSLTLLGTSAPITVGASTSTSAPSPTPTPTQTPIPTPTPTSTTTPALTLNGSTGPVAVTPGATMSVNVVNPTGNALDWIGIYQVGQSSSTKSVVEHYVASTDYTIPSSTPAGTYEARLFANDSLTLLATSAPITVGTASTTTPLPTTSPITAPTPTPSPTPPSPTTSTGQVYYVSPGGSDSNTGSASSPWHSIRAAAQRLQAGDTAILMDGVYEEGSVSFANNGTAGNPITIKAQNKWGAVLSSVAGDNPAISINRSYITIQDLRISVSPNNPWSGVQNSANAAIRAWETNTPTPSNPGTGNVGFTARGLLVDYSPQHSVGIKTNQDYSLVENCEVHCSIEGFNNTGTIFRNNVVYGNDYWGDSIYGKGGMRNFQVYGNVVHMTQGDGRGLFLGGNSGNQWVYDSSTGYEAYDSIAYNNTIYNETGNSNAATLGLVGTMNCTLKDNVIVGGGQVFQSKGGPYLGTPAPMPVNSTITNNTYA